MHRPLDEQTLDFMPPIFAWHSQAEQQMLAKEDDEDDDDVDEDDDDEDDDEEERTPEQLKADNAALKSKLERANAEAKRRRLKLREVKTGDAPKPKADAAAGVDDVEARIAAAKAEATAGGELRIKKSEAKGALTRAGVADDRVARAIRLLDLDALDVDDDGVIGLDDAIEALEAEMPELFEKPRRRRRSPADVVDRDGDRAGVQSKKTTSQRQADLLLGKSA